MQCVNSIRKPFYCSLIILLTYYKKKRLSFKQKKNRQFQSNSNKLHSRSKGDAPSDKRDSRTPPRSRLVPVSGVGRVLRRALVRLFID